MGEYRQFIFGKEEWKQLRKKFPNCFSVVCHNEYCYLKYKGMSVGSWKLGNGYERFIVLSTVLDTMTTLRVFAKF